MLLQGIDLKVVLLEKALISVRPAYSGLTNNVPTKLQELKGFPWPERTEPYVNVRVKQEYIQSYSRAFGIEPLTKYNTRVEKLQKIGDLWQVRSTTLIGEGPEQGKKIREVDVSNVVMIAELLLI